MNSEPCLTRLTKMKLFARSTRCMTEANNAEELESSLIAFAVLCRESSKSSIPLPPLLPAAIRGFFQEYHDAPHILSKKLIIILLEVLDSLLGGPLEQIRVVIEDGTVPILFRLIHCHHPKRHRQEETRAVTLWSLRCLQKIAIHQKICAAAFSKRLPELAELLRCVLAAAPVSDRRQVVSQNASRHLYSRHFICHLNWANVG